MTGASGRKPIGLLGGVFDPVHIAHLDMARACRDALDLQEVRLIPANEPPHKSGAAAGWRHRFAMLERAVAEQPRLVVSDSGVCAGRRFLHHRHAQRRAGPGPGTTALLHHGNRRLRVIAILAPLAGPGGPRSFGVSPPAGANRAARMQRCGPGARLAPARRWRPCAISRAVASTRPI